LWAKSLCLFAIQKKAAPRTNGIDCVGIIVTRVWVESTKQIVRDSDSIIVTRVWVESTKQIVRDSDSMDKSWFPYLLFLF
jgi:hypothetical protein